MLSLLHKFSRYIYGNQSLISDEGEAILTDPVKRVKLRKIINLYHKTGVWDFTSLNEQQ